MNERTHAIPPPKSWVNTTSTSENKLRLRQNLC